MQVMHSSIQGRIHPLQGLQGPDDPPTPQPAPTVWTLHIYSNMNEMNRKRS